MKCEGVSGLDPPTDRDDAQEVERDEPLPQRPTTRGECKDGIRPCPWARCRYNNMIDVTETGTLILNYGLGDGPDDERAGASHRRPRGLSVHTKGPLSEVQIDELIAWWFDSDLPTCSLDVADAGGPAGDDDGETLDVIGKMLSVTRERTRQVERDAMNDAKVEAEARGLRALVAVDKEDPDP